MTLTTMSGATVASPQPIDIRSAFADVIANPETDDGASSILKH